MQKLSTVLIALVFSASPAYCLAADTAKPNFVIINIDDLGYADVQPFGSTLNRTPNIQRMADEGRKLTSFYAAPVCSPSRASLMTGSYPKRVLSIPHVLFPSNAEGLAPQEITIAELLKQAGYTTGCVGKWHLGDQPPFLPTRQGFDEYFGLPYSNDMGPAEDGVKSNFGAPLPAAKKIGQPPLPLMRNETVLKRVLPEDQCALVASYTDEAIAFLKRHWNEPFFLYMPHSAVHFPIYPGDQFRAKSPHGMYSDWVEEVDWSVGQVLNTIRELDLDENTLVIFTSDNGGTNRGSNKPLRGHKGSTWEGGIRVCTIARWPGKIPAGTSCDAICGMFDVLPTFASLADAKLPNDRKLDGVDISPILFDDTLENPPHEDFLYYRGLNLQAVRQGDWKLHLETNALYNLSTDIAETTDVSMQHPEIVAKLTALANATQDDLGVTGIGPGCRPFGQVKDAMPLISRDGKIRVGFQDVETDASNP